MLGPVTKIVCIGLTARRRMSISCARAAPARSLHNHRRRRGTARLGWMRLLFSGNRRETESRPMDRMNGWKRIMSLRATEIAVIFCGFSEYPISLCRSEPSARSMRATATTDPFLLSSKSNFGYGKAIPF